MTKAIPLVALMLALGACGGGESNVTAPATNEAANAAAEPGSNVVDQVMALSDAERNGVFIRALIDSNIRCDNVTQSERVSDVEGNPTWRVHCTNGSAHVVTLLKDGTARVLTRSAPQG